MASPAPLRRIGLVVHPRRDVSGALRTLDGWAAAHGVEVVQARAAGQEREVAAPADARDCDLLVALGGDGTTLAAVRAAAGAGRPVLGVACGSIGALSATSAAALPEALDRVAVGAWSARRLPAVTLERDGADTLAGVNDVVVIREGAGQVVASVHLDGEPYVRFAGDGLVVSTPLGSSAYTMAAGGPLLVGAPGLVLTPLAPHGGCCPPLVAGPASRLSIVLEPGHGGARIEVDGQVRDDLERLQDVELVVRWRADHGTLVALGDAEPLLAGLRRRGILADSPRVLARDARAAAR